MDERAKTIGINFEFNLRWYGGINYLINIINSFNYLEKSEQPDIIIYISEKKEEIEKLITYKKVSWVKLRYVPIQFRYLLSSIMRKNYFFHEKMNQCDYIFPFNNFPIKPLTKTKLISWIPDFQHKIYKHNFSFLNLILREFRFKLINKNSDLLILSSNDALKDYKKFYIKRAKKVEIIPFVSVIEERYNNKEILKKYNLIENKYLIVSNQFHLHKNFEIVISSFEKFFSTNKDYKLVITGTAGKKNSYYSNILDMINDKKSKSNIIFTGFLNKSDVLSLIYFSKSLIQPSKFEGWNTAIEDCKSMGVPVIASNISVHKEQLGQSGNYFDLSDNSSLLKILTELKSIQMMDIENLKIRYNDFSKLILNKFES
jgi:glycosyltransferase involved in cell wall biosynthesis